MGFRGSGFRGSTHRVRKKDSVAPMEDAVTQKP